MCSVITRTSGRLRVWRVRIGGLLPATTGDMVWMSNSFEQNSSRRITARHEAIDLDEASKSSTKKMTNAQRTLLLQPVSSRQLLRRVFKQYMEVSLQCQFWCGSQNIQHYRHNCVAMLSTYTFICAGLWQCRQCQGYPKCWSSKAHCSSSRRSKPGQ